MSNKLDKNVRLRQTCSWYHIAKTLAGENIGGKFGKFGELMASRQSFLLQIYEYSISVFICRLFAKVFFSK